MEESTVGVICGSVPAWADSMSGYGYGYGSGYWCGYGYGS